MVRGRSTRRRTQPMKLPRIQIGPPQRLAAVLLLIFIGECLAVISNQQLTQQDYRYARCGREMWERPSPLAGYYTTCGNLSGDGTFAYRLAGFPLTAQRVLLLATDKLRPPENRVYAEGALNGSTWEARHELWSVKYLLHLPFVFFAAWLGGGLWWVARRLYGNAGGFFALGLYCFCPAVVRYAVVPNNEVLAMWGVYGLVYTAIGVAHAMQGPRRKWKPRIALLMMALGLTAAAHLVAAIVGFTAAVLFMFYVAERRRSAVIQIPVFAMLGALVIVFAFYGFRLAPFTYVFTGGAGRFWFSLRGALGFVRDFGNWPILIAAFLALVLYAGVRRSRYFGNTTPLLMVLLLAPLAGTQVTTMPWLWALPFLFTFIGGTFADAIETRQRKLFLIVTGSVLAVQAFVCLSLLPSLGSL